MISLLYMNGYSDVFASELVGDEDLNKNLTAGVWHIGSISYPMACHGIRSLHVLQNPKNSAKS